MPAQPPRNPKRPAPPKAAPAPAPPSPRPPAPARPAAPPPARRAAPQLGPLPASAGDLPLGVAVSAEGGGTVTARRAGGLRDMALDVDPERVGLAAALQHLAKAVNIAFQTDYGENYLESVYQAAIVRRGEIHVVH